MIATLADTTKVDIRPIRAGDKTRLADGFARLSDAARYQRFLSAKPRLSGQDLRYLTEVDGQNHFALLALLALPAGDPETVAGVARFVRHAADSEVAEFAIVVGDRFQGRGLGRLLAEGLVEAARSRGITRFTATMLVTNTPAHRLLDRVATVLVQEHSFGAVHEMVADIAA